MKPLLIIPPAPARWPPLEDLLRHKGQPWLRDIEQRLLRGVPGAQDAYGVIQAGGQFLASACINKYGDVGVLGHCFTRPEHRREGYARQLVEAVVSWFDMTGGQWLFLGTTAELDEGFYRKFGFLPLRRVAWTPYDHLTMWRPGRGASGDPFVDLTGEITVRDLTRAEWPAMVALLQYCPGPDPRVPLDESAVTADAFTLDLADHLERGACALKGAFRGPRLIGLATVAADRSGEQTYGMLMPHTGTPPELLAAAIEFAHSKGYTHVDFPMEGLRSQAPSPAAGAPTEPPTDVACEPAHDSEPPGTA
jgi:GNAT superfamily N-acetyltransferase